jgi:hypothetical protein
VISVVPFKHKYFKALIAAMRDQNYDQIDFITMKTLPKVGWVALLEGTNEILAAGFLRRVEGGYGQFDTFVTNPYFGSKIRHLALEAVINALLSDAETMGLTGILAITKDEGIKKRALEIGFSVIPHTLLAKNKIIRQL